jgi:hypothetical protein
MPFEREKLSMRKFLMPKRARCSVTLGIFPTVRVFKLKALMFPRNTGRENIQTLGSPLVFSEALGNPWFYPNV